MKKVYVAILAVLYLAVSSGVALELHYCMGDRAGMDFYGTSSDTCGKCGMSEEDSGCCHDDFKFYKLSDSHKNATNNINFAADELIAVNSYFTYNWLTPDNTALNSINNHSPPDYTGPSANIMNCVFRI